MGVQLTNVFCVVGGDEIRVNPRWKFSPFRLACGKVPHCVSTSPVMSREAKASRTSRTCASDEPASLGWSELVAAARTAREWDIERTSCTSPFVRQPSMRGKRLQQGSGLCSRRVPKGSVGERIARLLRFRHLGTDRIDTSRLEANRLASACSRDSFHLATPLRSDCPKSLSLESRALQRRHLRRAR